MIDKEKRFNEIIITLKKEAEKLGCADALSYSPISTSWEKLYDRIVIKEKLQKEICELKCIIGYYEGNEEKHFDIFKKLYEMYSYVYHFGNYYEYDVTINYEDYKVQQTV